MSKLAKSFEITKDKKVLIDGEEFPWFVADETVEVVYESDRRVVTVWLPILAESADVRGAIDDGA